MGRERYFTACPILDRRAAPAYCYNGPVVRLPFPPRRAAWLLALLLGPLAPGPRSAEPPGPASASRAPSAAVRYGLLWLEVDPLDAHVALDGRYLDRGVWLISLPPGVHDIAVRKDGFRPWARRVGVGPGESLRLAVRLERDPL